MCVLPLAWQCAQCYFCPQFAAELKPPNVTVQVSLVASKIHSAGFLLELQ